MNNYKKGTTMEPMGTLNPSIPYMQPPSAVPGPPLRSGSAWAAPATANSSEGWPGGSGDIPSS